MRFEDGRLEIGLEASAPKTLTGELSKKLAEWTGRRWMVIVSAEPGMPSLYAQAQTRKAELKDGVRGDPLVQAVLARFPGAEIVDVRPPAGGPAAAGRDTARCAARRRPRRRRTHEQVTRMVDFLGLMKQATELKSKMEAMQAELDRIEVEGTAGGGLVTLKLSGKGEVRAAHVDDSLLKPDQKEILRGPDCRRARRRPPQARSAVGRTHAGAHRRPAAAAGAEIVLSRCPPSPPVPRSNA